MVTAKAPGPALLVFTTNSHAVPGGYRIGRIGVMREINVRSSRTGKQTVKVNSLPLLFCLEGLCVTCGSSLQSWAVGRHHPRVSSLASLSDSDLKRTTWDVTSVELHIDEIEAVLSGDEPDCILI